MKYAAFFRNLNLGRPNCPTRAQFEAAFAAAGADSPSSFLTNGSIVFSAAAGRALQVLAAARKALAAECGLAEPAYLRSLEYLTGLVALDPFASVERGSVYQCCVSFLPAQGVVLPAPPLESPRRDVEVLRFTAAEALSLSRKIGNTPGSPNAFLEKLLGAPVTTRNWNTVVRLVHKHG